ncbi:MAG TPA: class I SAM-dependent methyltransferase [Dehalococcoidia bacterium]|nr:class I SAM-dependent methyltransferase [Dehalococcoidia bacterium]
MNHIFDPLAEGYDAWFDSPEGACIFGLELACLRPLLVSAPHPWLEIGVGTGRFARALGVEYGIDSSPAMLRKAAARGIAVAQGLAECLPYRGSSFGAALLVVPLCFLDKPRQAFAEAALALRSGGLLVAGIIPADSAWGQEYARKAKQGHPIYSRAHFHTAEETVRLAELAGFRLRDAFSCLRSAPGEPIEEEQPAPGVVQGAGFVALAFDLACNTGG